jgi:hypothetical protein
MTDRYPPFRLDLGGAEPDTVAVPDDTQPSPPTRWTGVRITLVVLGSLAALIGAALLAAGATGIVVHRVARDDAGYVMSPTKTFSTRPTRSCRP